MSEIHVIAGLRGNLREAEIQYKKKKKELQARIAELEKINLSDTKIWQDEVAQQNIKIVELLVELEVANKDTNLWKLRVDETSECIEDYEEIKAELAAANETSRNLAISGIEAGQECYNAADIIMKLQATITRLTNELEKLTMQVAMEKTKEKANPDICQVCGINIKGMEHSCM